MRHSRFFIRSQSVQAACALAVLFMPNTTCGDDDPKPKPVKSAEVLTYAKQTITYDDLAEIASSNDKKATASINTLGMFVLRDKTLNKKLKIMMSETAMMMWYGVIVFFLQQI